jgi:hypothetical protein
VCFFLLNLKKKKKKKKKEKEAAAFVCSSVRAVLFLPLN